MSTQQDDTAAKVAIAETMANYATGLDTKNWDMVRQCFCDEILIDYGPISAPSGAPDIPRRAEDWLQILTHNLRGFDVTHHMIGNHRYTVQGNRIACVSYMVAEHIIFEDPATLLATEGRYITVGGYYSNIFAEVDGCWRIAESKLAVTWLRGDPGLFEQAALREMT